MYLSDLWHDAIDVALNHKWVVGGVVAILVLVGVMVLWPWGPGTAPAKPLPTRVVALSPKGTCGIVVNKLEAYTRAHPGTRGGPSDAERRALTLAQNNVRAVCPPEVTQAVTIDVITPWEQSFI
jgi:hypothetical protein